MTKKMKAALELAALNPPQPDEKSLQPRETKQKKVTQKSLDKFQREKYLENISYILEAAYPMLVDKIKQGDTKCLQMGFEIANLLKPKGEVSVITQVYNKTQVAVTQSNGNSDAPGGIQSFESILRRLETTERVIDVTAQ